MIRAQRIFSTLALLQLLSILCFGQQPQGKPFPANESLEYTIEWRLITAGTAKLTLSQQNMNWETKLELVSAGMVSRLYRVQDEYRSLTSNQFCGINATLTAQEGKRHRLSTLLFDNGNKKTHLEERDLVKNTVTAKELPAPPCTHEILGALAALRLQHLDVGKSISIPITSGKKTATARIEAQVKEEVSVGSQHYQTIRYEAFVFDNVLYQRKGSLWIWLTDDAERLPVQLRVRLGFPIGNINLMMTRHEYR